mgnify:CR=1 FL=1
MQGIQFLEFLKDKQYINEMEFKNYQERDLLVLIDNFYKTSRFSEERLVKYLNEWKELPVQLSEVKGYEVTFNEDIVEDHEYIKKYCITPISCVALNPKNPSVGGIIRIVVPLKYANILIASDIRPCLNTVYQTTSWKIELLYAIDACALEVYFKYVKKFLDSNTTSYTDYNLRQKFYKVFRDAVNAGAMDIVFLRRGNKIKVLRKFMNEFPEYNDITFDSPDDMLYFRNMLISNIAGVTANKQDSEPNIGFKIPDLLNDGKYEGRVDYMETKDGWQFHVRIIKLENNNMRFKDYNLHPIVKQEVLEALNSTSGLIVITGPRGSGKQVFTYTCINEYRDRFPRAYIETLEDPVEARIEGNVSQIEVEPEAGYNFAYYLRGWKRHSTNLYFVGELRDRETVEASVTEASSASLVITTTHCGDCAEVIKKLSMELKGDDNLLYKLINTFKVVVNLTMAKKACPRCAKKVNFENLTPHQQEFLKSWKYGGNIYVAPDGGCEYCRGFNHDKLGKFESDGSIYEPMIVVESLAFNSKILELLSTVNTVDEKERLLRKYMINNHRYKTQMALHLLNQGKLTLQEVMRLFSKNIY